MSSPLSPKPESFASDSEQEFWHVAQDIAFRAEKSLIFRDGSTWLVSPDEEVHICSPQNSESIWWETWMALKNEFPELSRLWVKGRALTKPGEMKQRDRRFAREAERVLAQHSAVRECAVLGTGENCIAFVELASGAALDPIALMTHCHRHIDRFKTPQRFRAIERLPRDSSGMIDYEELSRLK